MTIREPRSAAPRAARRLLACLTLAGLFAQAACDDTGSGNDGGMAMDDGGGTYVQPDADTGPAERDADATPPGREAGPEAGSEDDAGLECERNSDCDDQLVCNGDEVCVEGRCQPGTPIACPDEHPCREALKGCDCTNPDADNDGAPSAICEDGPGADCDDGNREIGPHAFEICDEDGVDEDCDPTTFHGPDDGDNDDDGFISVACRNWDPAKDDYNRGNDCRDNNPSIHPRASEVCDYEDNNCNGVIDEKLDSNGEPVGEEGGLRGNYWPDRDGDGCGDRNAEPVRYCDFARPVGYVGGEDPCDCNDDPEDNGANIHDGADEVCDGHDNDCDNAVDEEEDLVREYSFPQTVVECAGGDWVIAACPENTAWCDESTVRFGCETDTTRLSSCQACESDCKLACGAEGCDEAKQLALGGFHSCARTTEDNVACWGRGGRGRLGTDSEQSTAVPAPVVLTQVSAIASAFDHTCAVAGSEGNVYCWGENQQGQLGNPEGGNFSVAPIRVLGSEVTGAVQVATGEEHSCAVLENGEIRCWGEQSDGRLGNGYEGTGPATAQSVSHLVYYPEFEIELETAIDNASQVAAGARHSCARLDDGSVECWGSNGAGQLGADRQDVTVALLATKVQGIEGATMVAVGHSHSCALVAGEVYCWGANTNSQLGRAADEEQHVPKKVEGLGGVSAIALGHDFSCALRNSGQVVCWGLNARGVFGVAYEQTPQSAVPVTLPFEDAVEIAAGGSLLCAQTLDAQVHCLGDNVHGQAGNGRTSPDPLLTPVQVEPLRGSKP